MQKRPFFLLTNDDGIAAPGIRHLWEIVSEFADVAIVAPSKERSGSGVSITWTKPLKITQIHWDKDTPAWSLNGTPADCVKMADSYLLKRKPDMILSGINRGSNAGRTVFYSGTVGGIIEGTLKGIPGIAFSFCDFDPPPVSATKPFLWPLIRHFMDTALPQGTFLNVNIPENAASRIAGVRLAKQGKGYWVEAPEKRIHPEGIPYYWLGGKWQSFEEDESSDVAALEQGYIAVTPIQIQELTNMDIFHKERGRLETLFTPDQQKILNPQ